MTASVVPEDKSIGKNTKDKKVENYKQIFRSALVYLQDSLENFIGQLLMLRKHEGILKSF